MTTDDLGSLLDLSPEERRRALDGSAADELIALLADSSRTRQRIAAEVIAALTSEVPELAALLRNALSSDVPRFRWGAAFTLDRARLAGIEIWPAVRETLGLADGDQRWAAAEIACRLARAHPEVHAEIGAGTSDPSPVVRRMCLYCLRDLGGADASGVAQDLLADPDSGVRLAALSTLAQAARAARLSASCADAIARLLGTDPDPGVRRAIAATLGRIGIPSDLVMLSLERAAEDADPSLARAARAALALLKAPPTAD